MTNDHYTMIVKHIIFMVLILNSCTTLKKNKIIEGADVNNTNAITWEGVNIKRYAPVAFVYRNNSITSINASGYMLQAGDEGSSFKNNNLDSELITGNQLIWNGSDFASLTRNT